ncbi:MAG: hypothetical protein IIV72_03180 [Alistipes sp.]|jgi:hypothetical protein|nr:hypothetical protein [Alistipes sp.]
MGKKLLQLVLALAVIGLGFYVYVLISTPIKFAEEQKIREKAVITRIKDIRTAERQFKSKYQHFTADFDSLINFVLNETMEGERKIVDEDDSVAMARLKRLKKKNIEKFTYSVKDSLFKHLTVEDIQNLRYIPYSDNKEFYLEAAILTTESKIVIPTVECRAPYINFLDTVVYRQEVINLVDNCLNVLNKYPGIKFGSMERGNNEAGNWEEL